MTDNRTTRIRALNDCLRCTGVGGQVVITQGIQALGPEKLRAVIAAVTTFVAFSEDNDPHGEHDFAALTVEGARVMFKIDYYDRELTYGSEDPADPQVTRRVMTVLLAEEW
jgi:hypothetical protein